MSPNAMANDAVAQEITTSQLNPRRLQIQKKDIPIYPKDKGYPYLGHDICIANNIDQASERKLRIGQAQIFLKFLVDSF